MWTEDSSRIEALMLTNSNPGQGSGGISHKLFHSFNSLALHFRKDGCIFRYGFYHDFPFWSTGPSFVIKGGNTNELNLFYFMLYIVGVKILLSFPCVQYLPLFYFPAHHIARMKPWSRQWTERQGSLLEKCHLMALVVQVMCHLWRTWSSDSCFWVILVYLKQLVLSLRHLSTWADDALIGALSPATSNQEKLSSCEDCDFQLKKALGYVLEAETY